MSKVEKCLEVRVEGEFGWPRISRNMLNTLFEIQLRFILPRNQEILTVCFKIEQKSLNFHAKNDIYPDFSIFWILFSITIYSSKKSRNFNSVFKIEQKSLNFHAKNNIYPDFSIFWILFSITIYGVKFFFQHR